MNKKKVICKRLKFDNFTIIAGYYEYHDNGETYYNTFATRKKGSERLSMESRITLHTLGDAIISYEQLINEIKGK